MRQAGQWEREDLSTIPRIVERTSIAEKDVEIPVRQESECDVGREGRRSTNRPVGTEEWKTGLVNA